MEQNNNFNQDFNSKQQNANQNVNSMQQPLTQTVQQTVMQPAPEQFVQPVEPQQPVETVQPPQKQDEMTYQYIEDDFKLTKQETNRKRIAIIAGIIAIVIMVFLGILLLSSKKENNNIVNGGINGDSEFDEGTGVQNNLIIKGNKEILNLVILGANDSGKEEFYYNLLKTHGSSTTLEDIEKKDEMRVHGAAIHVLEEEITSVKRKYNLIEFTGTASVYKYLIMHNEFGCDSIDGAILVVSSQEGVIAPIHTYLSYLNKIGVSKLVVYINDDSENESTVNMVEDDVRELLKNNGFDSKNTPIVIGEKDKENIEGLMVSLENWIETPRAEKEKPFFMSIEDVFTITGRGTVVTGRIDYGQVKLNDEIEIVGLKDTKQTVVVGIEEFRKELEKAEAGDNVGILIKGIHRDDIEIGQVLAEKGTIKGHKKFRALIYYLSKDEGGNRQYLNSGYKAKFTFEEANIKGTITLTNGVEMIMPGDESDVIIDLELPMAMERGTKFSFMDGGRTLAFGVVTEILE